MKTVMRRSENAFMSALVASFWLVVVVLFLTGCSLTLTGGGEMSIGMRNDNFLVLRHTVDGDKVGKESEAQLAIDQTVLDAILPSSSEALDD